jgi:uncharacterized protein (TIGR00369 family)
VRHCGRRDGNGIRKHSCGGESFTTVELKINFFRPVWEARLTAEGRVVQRGRTMGYVECEITDEENRLVAKAAYTCTVLRDQKAVGR